MLRISFIKRQRLKGMKSNNSWKNGVYEWAKLVMTLNVPLFSLGVALK